MAQKCWSSDEEEVISSWWKRYVKVEDQLKQISQCFIDIRQALLCVCVRVRVCVSTLIDTEFCVCFIHMERRSHHRLTVDWHTKNSLPSINSVARQPAITVAYWRTGGYYFPFQVSYFKSYTPSTDQITQLFNRWSSIFHQLNADPNNLCRLIYLVTGPPCKEKLNRCMQSSQSRSVEIAI